MVVYAHGVRMVPVRFRASRQVSIVEIIGNRKIMSHIKQSCTCIVPFYNEGARVMSVLKTLINVPSIAEIICVDDGSVDNQYEKIKKEFLDKNIQVLRLDRNMGKSNAVKKGLEINKSEYVMLVDADLSYLNATELEHAISVITRDKTIDMLVLRRKNDPLLSKIIRSDVTVTGERILRADDLTKVLEMSPHKYQLEFAIDFYMMTKKKKCYWMYHSGISLPKVKKTGLLNGIKNEIKMCIDIINFAGIIPSLGIIFLFARKQAPVFKDSMPSGS